MFIQTGESAKPSCTPSKFQQITRNIAENVGVGTSVFQYTGYDRDGDPIRFVAIGDILPFSIPTTGRGDVELAESLDFETKTQHTIENV